MSCIDVKYRVLEDRRFVPGMVIVDGNLASLSILGSVHILALFDV
jgi:hypothetical protein